MIRFRCPHCDQKLGVPDEYAGRRVRCTRCDQPAGVPQGKAPVVEEVAVAPAVEVEQEGGFSNDMWDDFSGSEDVGEGLEVGETVLTRSWGRGGAFSLDGVHPGYTAHAHIANSSYAASKHAIESYSRSAAAELGNYGITVNIVAPGPTQTGYITPEDESSLKAGTPLGRLGKPEDIAKAVAFLASDDAGYITGQVLCVDGGMAM